MTKRQTRWLVLALGGAVVAVLALCWVWFPGRPFDRATWLNEKEIRQGVRLEMADRLVARDMLVGKTRPEVVMLLGEPPPTGYFANWDLVYWLGPERGFLSIDSEWLVLRLGANGRVVDNRIVND